MHGNRNIKGMVQEIWLHILNLQVKQWTYQQETWNIVHDNCDRHIAVGYYSTSVVNTYNDTLHQCKQDDEQCATLCFHRDMLH